MNKRKQKKKILQQKKVISSYSKLRILKLLRNPPSPLKKMIETNFFTYKV